VPRKYVRQDFREYASGTHGRFASGLRGRRSLDPRQRLLAIYVGLLGAAVVLFVFHAVDPFNARRQPTLRRGQGTVVRKIVKDEGTPRAAYYIEIGVHTEDGRTLSDMVPVDEESWARTAAGETVDVEYHMVRQGSVIRVTKIRAEQGSEARSTRQERRVCSNGALWINFRREAVKRALTIRFGKGSGSDGTQFRRNARNL